jgi:hypothetical protein
MKEKKQIFFLYIKQSLMRMIKILILIYGFDDLENCSSSWCVIRAEIGENSTIRLSFFFLFTMYSVHSII